MTPDERNLITGLFDRLGKTEAATGAKDLEALQLIQQRTVAVPSAPYLLVQTVLVQEHALTNAQARIADLERQVATAQTSGQAVGQEGGGSFLGNLIKKATGAPTTPPPLPAQARGPGQAMMPPPGGAMPNQPGQPGGWGQQPPQAAPYQTTNSMPASGGGSFLKSALGTAAGVAGGAMLFQGIQNLMGHNAGPFAGGMSGLGGGHSAGGGQGFLGGASGGNAQQSNASFGDTAGGGGGSVGDYADRFGGGGESSGSGGGGGTVGDFADRFGGESGGGGGGGTVGDYADAQGGGGHSGGGFFDSAPEVQDAGFDEQGGGGTVGDYADNSGGSGDDGGGFFDDGGSDDATV